MLCVLLMQERGIRILTVGSSCPSVSQLVSDSGPKSFSQVGRCDFSHRSMLLYCRCVSDVNIDRFIDGSVVLVYDRSVCFQYALRRCYDACCASLFLDIPEGLGNRRNEAQLRCTHISWGQCFVNGWGVDSPYIPVFHENDILSFTRTI